MALVHKSGAGYDIKKSDSSEDELHYALEMVGNRIVEDSDVTSDPPSLASLFENLNLLSDSDENNTCITIVSCSVNDIDINSSHQVPAISNSGLDSPSILASVTIPILVGYTLHLDDLLTFRNFHR